MFCISQSKDLFIELCAAFVIFVTLIASRAAWQQCRIHFWGAGLLALGSNRVSLSVLAGLGELNGATWGPGQYLVLAPTRRSLVFVPT